MQTLGRGEEAPDELKKGETNDYSDLTPDLTVGIETNVEWHVISDIQAFYESLSPLADRDLKERTYFVMIAMCES